MVKWGEVASLDGKSYFFKKNSGSDELLIVLNTHNQKDGFFGYKMFCELKTDVNIVFITDPGNSYYLEQDLGVKYLKLIEKLSVGFEPTKVTIFGSSMAGFGAIYHGMKLGFNIIASNPQLSFSVSEQNAWPALRETISKVHPKQCINSVWLEKNYAGSVMYFLNGQHRLDVANKEYFLEVKLKRQAVFWQEIETQAHDYPFGRDALTVLKIHSLLVSYRIMNCFNCDSKLPHC